MNRDQLPPSLQAVIPGDKVRECVRVVRPECDVQGCQGIAWYVVHSYGQGTLDTWSTRLCVPCRFKLPTEVPVR